MCLNKMSILEMLSNLALLETLHLSDIPIVKYSEVVSPVYSRTVLSNLNSFEAPQDL